MPSDKEITDAIVHRAMAKIRDRQSRTTMTTEAKLFRIKPLEWEWFETNRKRGYRARVCGFPDRYVYQEYGDWGCPECSRGGADWSNSWFVDHANTLTRTGCASPEEGKQLAEAHWNEYIQQALIEVE